MADDRKRAAPPPHKLGRAKGRLKRLLAGGWQRAVFSTPQSQDTDRRERVLEGPGTGQIDADTFERWLDHCKDAAAEGLVKQCFVLDPHRRVEIDARHGIPRLRTRDERSIQKTMGGKRRPLRPDDSGELLRAIGIMNADGSISAKNAKKYKQVNHLVELCRPSWEAAAKRTRGDPRPLRVLDLGCGNSTLDFVIAEAARLEGFELRIHGVDRREALVERCRDRALQLGWPHLQFSVAEIGEAALHACDTATDDALALAIEAAVPSIFCVPCCQAELARQLGDPGMDDDDDLAVSPALTQHGLLRRAYADALTDALRVDLLEACGYSVQVLEFVSSEHTAKNLLLRAHLPRGHRPEPDSWALESVASRCRAAGIEPSLLSRLTALQARDRSPS
jgi:hypothetical protein